jgi:hypothetical protein
MLSFGPEEFEALDEDWKDTVVEKLDTGADRNQIKINVAGKQYFALAASVQVSRLSAFGFLLEGAESGVQNYRIDAVLDARTCEVCKHLDGWVFPLDSGLRQAQLIMDTDDPDALKQIAPFYAQTKASLLELATYGTDDLIDMGMLLPPFHPLCRCILTPTDEASDVHPTQVSDRVALASQALYGAGDGTRLTRELFGIEEPSEEASRRLGDVVPDLTPEEEAVPEWLAGLITESGTEPPPAKEAAGWIQDLVTDWLAQPAADAPPPPLVTPNPFEGTTIPQRYAEPFSPERLRQVAEMRWPWLAGILGWLALGRKDTQPSLEEQALADEEELADIERDERNELREDRRR